MIIDAHAHTNGGSLGNFKSGLLASRGYHGGHFQENEEALTRAINHHKTTILDAVGTDVQFVSPRPFQLMHSETPAKLVDWYAQASNDVNALTAKIEPKRYRAVACLPQSLDIQLSRSCDTVIVTAEKIVSTEAIKRRPHLTEIPAFRVSAVVEAPWGAHPCPVLGFSRADDEHFSEYVSASHSEAGFEDYLSRYVTGVPDHVAYLERVGTSRLLHLLTSDPAA